MTISDPSPSRRPKQGAVTAATLLVPLLLTGCGSGDASDAARTVPGSSRVHDYKTIESLAARSDAVVVAHTDYDHLDPDPVYTDDVDAFALVPMTVDRAIKGAKGLASVTVSVEGARDSSGAITTDRLVPGKTYILFLTAIGSKEPGAYVTTGYLAGV
ncbi:hypothetical protein FB382_003640 [Nocardioides ginsengisegetis]|uniref:Uncharacterized protein n=1 Tax=Nocardioides ginsengisegetis TaxID=661491 RepID=A0A7W3PBE3_9ACTN|nr:hypothetical protein [Nocardioides ginsengisegetis]MBA8805349.1 hypothetical protein [Nocardioides ginsengisegetis]